MIKLQNLTPDVYSSQSRDFQLLERLFDIVLNYVKTNSDNLYTLPLSDNTDEHLIDLMTLTLGFKSRHHYNIKQLTSLCSAFCEALKNKGTLYSIQMAGNALLNSEGVRENLWVEYHINDDGTINHTQLDIFVPQDLSDLNLLKDLLIYILPAGVSVNIIRELKLDTKATTKFTTRHDVAIYDNTNSKWDNKISSEFSDVEDRTTSIVAKPDEPGLTNNSAKATPGNITNVTVIQPEAITSNRNPGTAITDSTINEESEE